MKKQLTILCVLLLGIINGYAQVLFSEDFNSYTLGELSTDVDGLYPGKGGWYVKKVMNPKTFPVEVIAEQGKGNVLAIGCNINTDNGVGNLANIFQKNINNLWANRIQGNNVMHLQYEVFISSNVNATEFSSGVFEMISNQQNYCMGLSIKSRDQFNKSITPDATIIFEYMYDYNEYRNDVIKNSTNYSYQNFLYDTWLTIHSYIEYQYNQETGEIIGGTYYGYIPALYTVTIQNFIQNVIPNQFGFGTWGYGERDVVVKLDNIQLSALNAVPQHVLNATKFNQMVFNVAPNPATNFVTINSAENALIQQIQVYDNAGKLVGTYTYSNQLQVQLNTEGLATGVYMLQIQTNTGKGYSKLIKK